MKRFFAVMLSIGGMFGIWSCQRELSFDRSETDGQTCSVDFSATGWELQPTATKTDINLPQGTTVRVFAYKRAAAVPNPAVDRYVTEKTYRILSDGSFLPCETDAAGVVTDPNGTPMELGGGDYDFYAYAPAVAMTARPTLSVAHGTDFIATAAVTKRLAGRRTNVDLLFTHKGSQLHFTVTRKADANTVFSVAMQEAGVRVEKLAASPAVYTLGGDVAVAGTAYSGVSELPGSRFTQVDAYTTAALDTVLPREANVSPDDDLKLTFHLLINDALYKTYTATVSSRQLVPGNRYLFNVTVKDGGAVLTLFELLPWTRNAMTDLEVGGDPSNAIVLAEWTEAEWSTGLGDEGVAPF